MRTTLYKNSFSGVLQLIISFVLTFVTIPIFIKILGTEVYGLFSVISVIGNLNIFVNLGLNTTLLKFLSEQGKTDESNLDIIVTLVITCLLLIPVTFISIYFNKLVLLSILNVPVEYYSMSKIFYNFSVLSNSFMLIGQLFAAVIDSQQKIILTNILQLVYNLMYWGCTLTAILLGFSLDVIGTGIFASASIWLILIVFSFYKIWGKTSFKGLGNNFKRVSKKQIKYSFQIYSSGLISLFYEPLTKILISNFLGIKEVGFFDIALKFRNQFQGLINKAYYPLLPYLAKLTDMAKIRGIIHDLEQKSFILLQPVLVIVFFCTYSFVFLWIGKEVELITFGVVVVLSSFFIGSFTIIPFYQYLLTKKPHITIVLQAVNVVINALVFLILYNNFGYYSVLIAYAVAILFSFVVSVYYQYKFLNSIIFDTVTQVIKVILLFLICFSSAYTVNIFLLNHIQKILIIPTVIILVSVATFRIFRFFKPCDLERYMNSESIIYRISSKLLIG
ncbi:MAG: oligosaccharide flippase family protein [Ignavibacteriae bacterium]|nr:oligosaccharide flippase family protein [Ignavibacteriota bacterium]